MTNGSSSSDGIPAIDLSGLDPAISGAGEWQAARSLVMAALERYGCFEAELGEITPELLEAVIGAGARDLFGLPLDVKQRNTSERPFGGYIGGIPDLDYESLSVDDATRPESVRKFAELMWPKGNPTFCDTLCSFTKILSKLDQIVRRMVLESLGVENQFDSLIESTIYNLRFSEYGAPYSEDKKINLRPHVDQSMASIVCQHQVQGLEILTKDGKWIMLSKNSIIFMVGETFMAWTNGKLEPPCHRVTMSGNKIRYSAIFGARPKPGYIVQSPEELVDDEHPLQFKPFKHNDYIKFRFSRQDLKEADRNLKAYCGVNLEP